MSFEIGDVGHPHHVTLPSSRADWQAMIVFWEGLGYTCSTKTIQDPAYDHVGTAARLQVRSGTRLIVSFYDVSSLWWARLARFIRFYTFGWIDLFSTVQSSMHVAIEIRPPALEAARAHPAFDRETHWGHGNTSVFLRAPNGLYVELVTHNPDFHLDERL